MSTTQIISTALNSVTRHDDERQCCLAWDKYLSEHLIFPFDAIIENMEDSEVFSDGDLVSVKKIDGYADMYGLIVEVRKGRKKYFTELCLLKVLDKKSSNHKYVEAYKEWFDNR
ncbi:MAG: hypothetical protein A2275_02145 [Bacteroidetes bacterium RIFOXYA12_FULL_35_11]|nr:MAG: hypothetical protein A2X01_00140 [Bacteroidetes bacterium GWF2_35_48]OFY76324.1 MAG: hypothetical protein A2275_02145 [Bacteroidetes bacterium RIFOXYA12_FULL_35_11]OFY97577.1 MAG: hypothetical protein A2309_09045 [Bacteroidetes bacterium RIFOXYB2_FULL_35_7]OFZ04629.1 MAG: hypothetical protein A2491_11700 [Bacteroidetes bacterium RIFOXYC12_FULL_35_7]